MELKLETVENLFKMVNVDEELQKVWVAAILLLQEQKNIFFSRVR